MKLQAHICSYTQFSMHSWYALHYVGDFCHAMPYHHDDHHDQDGLDPTSLLPDTAVLYLCGPARVQHTLQLITHHLCLAACNCQLDCAYDPCQLNRLQYHKFLTVRIATSPQWCYVNPEGMSNS